MDREFEPENYFGEKEEVLPFIVSWMTARQNWGWKSHIKIATEPLPGFLIKRLYGEEVGLLGKEAEICKHVKWKPRMSKSEMKLWR